jgi:hypothetical protein
MAEFIPAVELIYRDLSRPRPPETKPAAVTQVTKTLTLADVDAIIPRANGDAERTTGHHRASKRVQADRWRAQPAWRRSQHRHRATGTAREWQTGRSICRIHHEGPRHASDALRFSGTRVDSGAVTIGRTGDSEMQESPASERTLWRALRVLG